jgi:signal transduction histidine kinase
MNAARPHDVQRASIRVALAATALVAVAYFVVALAVVAIFTGTQTQQIDDRLASSLQHEAHEPRPGGGGPYPALPTDKPGNQPFLSWTVYSATVATPDGGNSLALPAAYFDVADPETVTIDGIDLRVAGTSVGEVRRVVGQSLEPVYGARSTLIAAELLIAPLLLGAVFLGAVAIGRRVATPVEQARRRQLEFTADASHELRTPLSVIEAQTSLALTQDRSEAWYRTAFGRVDQESKRMRRLLDDLLWLARFDATQGPPNAEPVDLAVLAAQTADRFAVVAETRHLNLRVNATGESMVVTAPPEWLDRLLGVLLDNACKYAGEGGTVTVGVTSEGARIALSVDDSGPGIPEGERSRIFDRFHRATDATGGAGLGLAIADAIVRATNGRWRIGTAPSGGARMSVSWPRAFSGPREAAATKPTTQTLPTE